MALQDWAIGYAARSRDAACGAGRSFYRWAQTPAAAGGPARVPAGTAKSLQFRRGGNCAAGEPLVASDGVGSRLQGRGQPGADAKAWVCRGTALR
ncbi:hypothetical protein [Streptomyces sp. NBC_00207]|uniref:hypothetical protein n=1 Tax=Streptomyces sp. NBC_00207 TaxID=2903635 RepID=UPI003248F860